MASIRSLGVGSGLDIDNLVQQLVAAERRPVESRLARSEARVQSQLSAFGTVSGALSALNDSVSALQGSDPLIGRSATSAEPEVFTATATPQAATGTFDVEVVELARADRAASQAFASSDTEVGTGTLELGLGGTSFTLDIDGSNNQLGQIRDAINAAADNPGITASVINSDDGSRLILSGNETGAANTLSVSASGGDGGLADLETLTTLQAASDAVVRVDGFEVTASENSISGVIQGVTLELGEARPGETFELAVTEDRSRVLQQARDLVERLNSLSDTVDRVTAFNPETGQAAPLLGDSALRNIESRISGVLASQVGAPGTAFGSLPALGIRTGADGQLQIDEARFNQALDEAPETVEAVLTGQQGVVTQLGAFLDDAVGDTGLIAGRQDGLRSRLDGIDEQRVDLEQRISRIEDRFLRQFSALDGLVANLNQTGNFLQQQLANLPGVRGSNG